MIDPGGALRPLRERVAEVSDLLTTMSVLNWDARVTMPAAGNATRGRQLATLARLARERLTADATLRALERAEEAVADLTGDDLETEYARREVAQTRAAVDVLRRVPERLVSELADARTVAQPAWETAREADDWSLFAPALTRVLALSRELADAIGYDAHPYDAALHQYEPDMDAARMGRLLGDLRSALLPLLERIRASDAQPPDPFTGRFPAEGQRRFGLRAARAFGWDPARGRLDVSLHPFEISFGRDDVRMTTRYREEDPRAAVFGILHECGHALYEQNVAPELARTTLTSDLLGLYAVAGTSFGAHESQARLWENTVGRSRAFWRRHADALRAEFPDQLAGADAETIYRAVNVVRPGFIRVEADEVTYTLHIALRTEIEMAMMDGTLAVADIPGAWNAKMESYLGLTPPDLARGALQDIHWAHGYIGSFPTYAVGNVMAAQLFDAARTQVAGLDDALAEGDYAPLRGWLRENVYRHGRAFGVDELLERSSGRALDAGPYREYLEGKFGELYPG